MRGVLNHPIDDEFLKEYFYRGHDDSGKDVLDAIAGGSYGEFTSAHIIEKLEKISQNHKAFSTRKSVIMRKTFVVQATNSHPADEIREEMDHTRTELGFAFNMLLEEQKR